MSEDDDRSLFYIALPDHQCRERGNYRAEIRKLFHYSKDAATPSLMSSKRQRRKEKVPSSGTEKTKLTVTAQFCWALTPNAREIDMAADGSAR